MSTEKPDGFLSQNNIDKTKEALKPEHLVRRLTEDRFSLFCTGLIGLSLIAFTISLASSTSHPQNLLSRYIQAGEEADLETLNELAPMNNYDYVSERLRMLYFQDIEQVVHRAQTIGARAIRDGHIGFIQKRNDFNRAMSENDELRSQPWSERSAFIEAAWNEAGGTGTAFVTNVTFNQYGAINHTSLWNDILDAYRNQTGSLHWRTRQRLERDLAGTELMAFDEAHEIIESIIHPSQTDGIHSFIASNGWTEAASQFLHIVGPLSYETAWSPQFLEIQGERLLPISLMTFYDDEFQEQDQESEIQPAGEGLFQPGRSSASSLVKGGIVNIEATLEGGTWRITSLSDIDNIDSLYNTIKTNNAIAPESTPTTQQEG
jgi:hypothetical protein